jgi:hypothetical protein
MVSGGPPRPAFLACKVQVPRRRTARVVERLTITVQTRSFNSRVGRSTVIGAPTVESTVAVRLTVVSTNPPCVPSKPRLGVVAGVVSR